MSKPIQQNSTNNTLRAVVYNTDGSIKTDLAFDTTGISIYVQKIGVADGSAMTLSAKSGTTWAAGAFLNLGGGDISVDVADAVFASFLGEVRIYGTFTGGTIVGTWYPVVAYNPNAVAVGANTIAPDNAAIALIRTAADDVIAETALVGAINGAVSVLPAVGISADRSPGVTLNAFVGETITQSITIYQTDGSTPFVLTDKTLVVVFETRQGVDVAAVTSGSITIGGDDDNVVTFAYPSDATSTQRVLKFAIRDASAPKTVYLQGLLNVQRAPQVD